MRTRWWNEKLEGAWVSECFMEWNNHTSSGPPYLQTLMWEQSRLLSSLPHCNFEVTDSLFHALLTMWIVSSLPFVHSRHSRNIWWFESIFKISSHFNIQNHLLSYFIRAEQFVDCILHAKPCCKYKALDNNRTWGFFPLN